MALEQKNVSAMLGVFMMLIVGLWGINHYLSQQIQQMDESSMVTGSARAPSKDHQAAIVNQPHVLVIDPDNDPLAPMALKAKPKDSAPSASTNPPVGEPIYEPPTDNVILVQ
jgi:hypothetical protein